ncbi:TRAP transporter small permease [Roseomonas sp. OT10]|uniref:TRAP transporter small permease n=1 Tax=Roseomonas cutis TaxID=2897332 RepID=UPI001E410721|nr:TRAP transporter small permease [Roseomonas sp. OT10]UFN49860.1 TRAP transporter small permease [Roseomonas sp. OT10]
MLRRALDALYRASAGLAALSLLGIFLVMMGQVALRELGRQLPAADDISAYLCVATTFFALAHTFRRGELIRVGLLLERLSPGPRRIAELVALALAALLVGAIAWHTGLDAMFSWEIEEVAQGTVPIPLWIPKLAMPLGAGILLLAILEEFVDVLRGRIPSYVAAAAERAAAGDFSAEV